VISHPIAHSDLSTFVVPTAPPYGHKRTMSPRASSSSSGMSQFTFVTGNIQPEARSHAMREHWKRRHQQNQEAKTSHQKRLSRQLPLRSKGGNNAHASSSADAISPSVLQYGEDMDAFNNQEHHRGVPAQLLGGMSYALLSSRPDPFQTCPVHLTSQHQKLLHHCAYQDLEQYSL
jgi:hypothetical protein